MAFKTLTCPSCGAPITIFDETTKKGICPYCNSVIFDVQERQREYAQGTRGELITKDADFVIKGGVLTAYNGEAADVVIPDGVKIIGDSAFEGMTGIESVAFPTSVVKVDNYAFGWCESLQYVSMPGVTEIGENAFCGCVNLCKVDFPDQSLVIGYGAFSECPSLSEVEFYAPVRFKGILEVNVSGCFDIAPSKYDEGVRSALKAKDMPHYCCDGLFEDVFKPSLKKVLFISEEAANSCICAFEDYSLKTAEDSFDAVIRAKRVEMNSLGFFKKKEKEKLQRQIDYLQAAKTNLSDWCAQIVVVA